MTMQMYRNFSAFFQAADQLKGLVRFKQSGHVFNTDGMRPHIFDLFAQIDPRIQSVYRAGGVGNGALSMSIGSEYCFYRVFNVTHVVHRIKNTEHVNTVDCAALDKFIDHIIGIMTIA